MPLDRVPGSGAEIVAAAISSHLAAEDVRKASLEARGNAVITTSGGLVTLLLAFAALVAAGRPFRPAVATVILLLAALGLFVIAAVLGLFTNGVRSYGSIKMSSLETTVSRDWNRLSALAVRRLIAESGLVLLKRARLQNERKATLLVGPSEQKWPPSVRSRQPWR